VSNYCFFAPKGGERVARGIIRGRRLFQIFPPKGDDYSRGTINRGTAIIRGNTLFNIKFVIAEAVYLDFVHLFISLISIFTQEHLIKRLVSIETVVLRR